MRFSPRMLARHDQDGIFFRSDVELNFSVAREHEQFLRAPGWLFDVWG